MWEPQAPTHFHTHTCTNTYILCITSEFLMKNKVYRNITASMISIGFRLLIELINRRHVFTSQMVAYPMDMDRIIPESIQYG